MLNPPDTDYFIYFYVFTCEKCNCPHIDPHVVPKAPRDEINQRSFSFECENCNSQNYISSGMATSSGTATSYAITLRVKNGKYLERHNPGM
jgi:hypothetical protein